MQGGDTVNKTLILIGFFVLILFSIIGAVVLIIFRPDQLGGFISAVTTLLGIGSAAVITIYGLGEQGKKLEAIKTQTNGTLSALHEENTRLTNLIIDQGVPVSGGGAHSAN